MVKPIGMGVCRRHQIFDYSFTHGDTRVVKDGLGGGLAAWASPEINFNVIASPLKCGWKVGTGKGVKSACKDMKFKWH